MTTMIPMTPEIPLNQRLWNTQKHNPRRCKFCKKTKLVFLRNVHGNIIACDAIKVVEHAEGKKILDEQGLILLLGKRIGWPVHDCPALAGKQQSKETHLQAAS